jgi:hypothetical protein
MFRFTIRDVLWLMVVVGLGFGWQTHVYEVRKEQQSKYDALMERNRRLELENAQVRSRADLYTGQHAQAESQVRAYLYEIKQLLLKRDAAR